MPKNIWKITGGLEQAIEWLRTTALGRIVAAVGIVIIGAIVALISSEPALGGWTILVLIVVSVLIALRGK